MKKPKKNNFFKIGKKVLLNEIKALTEVSDKISENEFNKLCNLLANTKGNLIFLGIGKSGKVSEKISATLSSLGRPSFYINAAEASQRKGNIKIKTSFNSNKITSFGQEEIPPPLPLQIEIILLSVQLSFYHNMESSHPFDKAISVKVCSEM